MSSFMLKLHGGTSFSVCFTSVLICTYAFSDIFNKGLHLYVFLVDSGVGAGIDSYYEYLLKAYVLLGDDSFLERFNTVS